jgi:hypothetical protein
MVNMAATAAGAGMVELVVAVTTVATQEAGTWVARTSAEVMLVSPLGAQDTSVAFILEARGILGEDLSDSLTAR